MFTPPASPEPSRSFHRAPEAGPSRTPSPAPAHLRVPTSHPTPTTPAEEKQRTARRTKWTSVLLVPLVLVLITASTHLLTHPAAFDLLAGAAPARAAPWGVHKRHPAQETLTTSVNTASAGSATIVFPSSVAASSSAAAASSSAAASAAASATAIPTIPASAPALPTPFPQALDGLSQNFSSESCLNFFVNMTQTLAFRECRPFSLLLGTSDAFIQAQNNITLMNDIIYGTCNTPLTQDTCNTNMNWFATQLQAECTKDLAEDNATADETLKGLLAYPLMRSAGCLADQSSNTYCYLDAVRNSNPSDLYFYQLPLGIALPNATTPTCSACTKSLLALYESALPASASTRLVSRSALAANVSAANNGTGSGSGQVLGPGIANVQQIGSTVPALGPVYAPAAAIASRACGSGYVATTNVASGAAPRYVLALWTFAAAVMAGAGMLLIVV